jgi:hypothetical protein
LPPEALSYQLYVPPGAVAVTEALLPAQMEAGTADGAAGNAITDTGTAVLALVQPDTVVCT